jgi:hypothetical protein
MKEPQLNTLQDVYNKTEIPRRLTQSHFKYFTTATISQPSLTKYNDTTKTSYSSQKQTTKSHFFSLTTPSKYIHSLKRRIKRQQQHDIDTGVSSYSKESKSASTVVLNKPIISKRFHDLWNNSNYNTSLRKIKIDPDVMNDINKNKEPHNMKQNNIIIKPRRKLYFPKHLIQKEISEIIREKYLTQINSLLFSKNDKSKIENEIANIGKIHFLTEGSLSPNNRNNNTMNINSETQYQSKIPDDFLYKEIKLEPIKKKHFKFNNPIQRARLHQFYTNVDTFSFPIKPKVKLSTFNYQSK